MSESLSPTAKSGSVADVPYMQKNERSANIRSGKMKCHKGTKLVLMGKCGGRMVPRERSQALATTAIG